ncbi:hypothetical protein GpartN1_g3029.t1 [Galdieria partita]|uniref:AMP-dependent synthetase/ligase domain-containing protein n=1 Tax=Galdieria partita TaxID=83374 RepID=A0A9C7PUR3_9RHOD|nr:hypothetical protein GpartN1_g3029.t1 [Galdieria partita]
MPQTLTTLRQLPRAEYASKLAIVYPKHYERKLSNSDLHREVEQNAAILRLAGFTPGTHLALCLDDPLEYFVVFLACMWVGVVVHPIKLKTTEEEMKDTIQQANLETIVCSDVSGKKSADTARTLAKELGLHCLLVSQNINEGIKIQMQDLVLKSMSFEDRHYKLEPSNAAVAIHVNSSQTDKKIVTYTHEQVIKTMELYIHLGNLTGSDVTFLSDHPSNCGNLIMQLLGPLSLGSTVMISPTDIQNEPSRFIERAIPLGMTWLSASPPLLKVLCEHPKANKLYEKIRFSWCSVSEPLNAKDLAEIVQSKEKFHVPHQVLLGREETLGLLFVYELSSDIVEGAAALSCSPIGKPVNSISAFLVDPEGTHTVEDEGELRIVGQYFSSDACNSSVEIDGVPCNCIKLNWICKLKEELFYFLDTTQVYLEKKRQLEERLREEEKARQEAERAQEEEKARLEEERQKGKQVNDATDEADTSRGENGSRLERKLSKAFRGLFSASGSGSEKEGSQKQKAVQNDSTVANSFPVPSHPRRKSADFDSYPKFDDREPEYFKVGKSTFSLAEIDYIIQKHPATSEAKSFLMYSNGKHEAEVHVALTLNPGRRVTSELFTKHLKKWGIRGKALPVHYYVCRKLPRNESDEQTREFIKNHCLSMPQNKVTEAYSDPKNSKIHEKDPGEEQQSRKSGSWLRRSLSKTFHNGDQAEDSTDGSLKRNSSKIMQIIRRASFSS